MIKGINHIVLAIKGVDKSFEFCKEISDFKPVVKWKNGAYLTVPDVWLALNQDSNISETKQSDYFHIAFSCESGDFQKK